MQYCSQLLCPILLLIINIMTSCSVIITTGSTSRIISIIATAS